MSNQVTLHEAGNTPAIHTPDNLLELAINQNADIDKLEKLMALKERYDANNAKTAFFASLGEFQAKVPVIEKTKQGHNYKYATLGAITSQIRGLLNDCGLTYRFEQNHDNGITVTLSLIHI